jgi:hypothetical protein
LLHRLQICNEVSGGLNDLPCRARAEIHPAAMSPAVHNLFSREIRDQCFSRFGVTAAQHVSNWHAFTFDAETPAGPSILKIAHSSHRTGDQLEAEIDWMLFLVSQGVGVPRIHASLKSLWVERVSAGDSYFSVVDNAKLRRTGDLRPQAVGRKTRRAEGVFVFQTSSRRF